ncbi:MAG: GerMN domain-containing protein [Lachnospiraceae bacterium]|nr:GerMN domain-containing protein [Lachnospiraceae bacterium]MEE1015428.1 GerMN domain-containing protein [Lachnospiraceae bacterium]
MKKLRIFLLLAILAVIFTGCGKEAPAADGTVVYYLNKDVTSIVPVSCKITGDGPEIRVEEFLAKLESAPESVDLRRTIPESVKILSYTLDRKQLYLDFSAEYLNMDKATEVLVRAAIVKTMVQVDEVSFIGIRVAGEPIKDSTGSTIGLMNENTFLDNMGSEENATKITNLNLYFANKTGDKLKNQSCVVEYNANVAVEKVIVEQLIAGPTEEGYYATIPKDTKVMNVTTKDGVCYVNLDTGFTGQGYDVLGTVTIYSIVNSLTELPGVTDVQILVNGETNISYKDNISLETIFQRNMEMIEKGE